MIRPLLAITSLCGKCAQTGSSDELAPHPATYPASRLTAAGIGSRTLPDPTREKKWLEDWHLTSFVGLLLMFETAEYKINYLRQ